MDAYIAYFSRTPFDFAHKGRLATTRPEDMLATVVKSLVKKSGLKASDIDDLLVGCAFPEGEQSMNIARIAVFLSELPETVPGATINRFCGSSMSTIHMATGAVARGEGDVFIAAGVESMSRIPMGGYNPMFHPDLIKKMPDVYVSMGETAENVAKKHKITRKQQQEFALRSHELAKNGCFKDEVISISDITQDGCIRGDTTMVALDTLPPIFDTKGTVTAGTASPLTDGAAGVIVCSEHALKKHKIKAIAKVKSCAVTGCDPAAMGMGPVSAVKKALKQADLKLSDIDVFELNEAFAAQALAVIKELKIPMDKVNIEGGAIALGHPLGASGARITGKCAHLMAEKGKKYGLATMCIGGGQGIATVLEAI